MRTPNPRKAKRSGNAILDALNAAPVLTDLSTQTLMTGYWSTADLPSTDSTISSTEQDADR